MGFFPLVTPKNRSFPRLARLEVIETLAQSFQDVPWAQGVARLNRPAPDKFEYPCRATGTR